MPTARELLEQAEALMRRNRAVTMMEPGVVPPPEETPTARGRGGSGLEADLPPEPADDFPLLTDAVDDFEPGVSEVAPVDDGEPSIWAEADDALRSIIGPEPDAVPAPPSLAVSVPPVVGAPAEAAEARVVEATVVETVAIEEAGAIVEAGVVAESAVIVEPVAVMEPMELPPADAPTPEAEAPPVVDAPAGDGWPPGWVDVPEFAPEPETGRFPDASAAVDPMALAAHHATVASAFGLPARIFDDPPAAPAVEAPPASTPLARSPGAIATPASAPQADDERWQALAEEIRMQVLQRIDIFTDTGLGEQLNRRLQPIVDRASADLVAAINQHVGQLLREYVAEAIEREIQKWRAGESGS